MEEIFANRQKFSYFSHWTIAVVHILDDLGFVKHQSICYCYYVTLVCPVLWCVIGQSVLGVCLVKGVCIILQGCPVHTWAWSHIPLYRGAISEKNGKKVWHRASLFFCLPQYALMFYNLTLFFLKEQVGMLYRALSSISRNNSERIWSFVNSHILWVLFCAPLITLLAMCL